MDPPHRIGSDTVLGAGDAQKMKDFIYLDETAVAPPPSRDYFRIEVTSSTVTLTQWRISHTPKTVPIETRTTLHGWNRDHNLLADVTRVYGKSMVDYINGLCHGKVDWIMVLPDPIFAKIFAYIGIKNMMTLSPVCKRFRKVCSSNVLWEGFFRTYRGKLPFEYDVKAHANYMSWKGLFFINRLQDNVFPGKSMVFGHRVDNEFRQFANQLRLPEDKRPWALKKNPIENPNEKIQSKPPIDNVHGLQQKQQQPNIKQQISNNNTTPTTTNTKSKVLESQGKIGRGGDTHSKNTTTNNNTTTTTPTTMAQTQFLSTIANNTTTTPVLSRRPRKYLY